MGGEWKLVRLGDHVDSCLGKMLDKNKNKGALHPYLGNKNVRWGRFELQNLSQMKFQEDEHDRYGLLSGDLIVCEGGEPGRCAIWKNEVTGMKIQKALHRIRPLDGLNNIYLYYWFVFSANNGLLDPFFTGTTIKHLTGKALADLQLPLPPLSEQKRIAHILGSLDDKIELNRQMNATLEGMAQALFKSWFVDFDPVIDNALAAGNPIPEAFAARAETRRNALADGTANRDVAKQFPAAFQFTEEMGWIPEGWEVKKAESIVTRKKVNQKFTKKNVLTTGQIPVFDQGAGLLLGYHNGLPDIKSSQKNPSFIFGDHTCITHLSTKPFSVGPNVIPLEAKNYNSYWTYFAIKDIQNFQEYRRHWMEFKIKNVLVPLKNLASFFGNFIQNLYISIESKTDESSVLTNLRDTLLPKLISGEIRIPEAEKLTEEALA